MRKKLKETDEPARTIEHIVRESGVTDESTVARVVKNLKPFWAQSTGQAQARGFRVGQKIEKEKENQP